MMGKALRKSEAATNDMSFCFRWGFRQMCEQNALTRPVSLTLLAADVRNRITGARNQQEQRMRNAVTMHVRIPAGKIMLVSQPLANQLAGLGSANTGTRTFQGITNIGGSNKVGNLGSVMPWPSLVREASIASKEETRLACLTCGA